MDDSKYSFMEDTMNFMQFNNNLNNFSTSSASSILITGEAGIGKTSLINKIILSLDSKQIVLKSICYNAEEDFFLKPWHSIFTILGNYVKSEKTSNNITRTKL